MSRYGVSEGVRRVILLPSSAGGASGISKYRVEGSSA